MITLSPVAGEPEFGDPAMAGDWAAVLPEMLAAEQVAPWCNYAARQDGVLVGLGGFKGPPDDSGWAEIAYLTLIPAEGQGVATQTAAALIDRARAAGTTRLCAHTLPEHNASTRVLERNGFACAGPVDDPEDGTVWRWEKLL